jgi:3-oxoacyl-[acyl-carrier protein] reductase
MAPAPGEAPAAGPGGRVALVTGGTGGIGQAIARALAAAGHPVAIGYARDKEAAAACAAAIAADGGTAADVHVDVTVPGAVNDMFDEVEGSWGPVQILVNSAGITRDGLLVSMTDEDWLQVLRTNLDGPFYCIRRAIRPMMRARWGRIVNISSVAGMLGSAGQTNYSASKAGLIGLTRALARELAPKRITVNAVAPGPVSTPMLSDLTEAQRDALVSMVPLGRMAEPDEVARIVTMLCAESAGYLTGVVVPVDGGLATGC